MSTSLMSGGGGLCSGRVPAACAHGLAKLRGPGGGCEGGCLPQELCRGPVPRALCVWGGLFHMPPTLQDQAGEASWEGVTTYSAMPASLPPPPCHCLHL